MIGIILHYSTLTQRGVICSEDTIRYLFHLCDWQEEIPLRRGMKVIFEINSQQQVIQIHQHAIAA